VPNFTIPQVAFFVVVLIAGVEGGVLLSRFFEESRLEELKIGTLDTLTLDASRRAIMVDGTGKFCSEPVPDAANTFAKEFAAKLSAAVESEKSAAAFKEIMNSDITKLFERSQGIQALRDGMYRLCEAFANNAITKETYEDHIGNLTATLNFIVPLELCAKLNREIVLALTNATGPVVTAEKLVGTNGNGQGTQGAGWPETFNKSELLTSKFTQSCIDLGSRFASRLAEQMVQMSLERQKEAAVKIPTSPAPTLESTSVPASPNSTPAQPDAYGTDVPPKAATQSQ
jgi:hypothetical protein